MSLIKRRHFLVFGIKG